MNPQQAVSSPDAQAERRAELLAAIKAISDELKGHGIPFSERLVLNEERKDLRAQLAEIREERL